jgi:hypothetical protein
MKLSNTLKFINYCTIIGDLYAKYGISYIKSLEFVSTLEDQDNSNLCKMKLLYTVAYECQDAFPETIIDKDGICDYLLGLLNTYRYQSSSDILVDYLYNMSVSFIYQFGVFRNRDVLKSFIKSGAYSNDEAKEIVQRSVYCLWRAIDAANNAVCNFPNLNAIQMSLYMYEIDQLTSMLRGHLCPEYKNADLDSVLVFSDQDDPALWGTLGQAVYEYVIS